MIRRFKTKDKEGVLTLIRLNTPKYFHPDEEKDLQNYLVEHADNYLVITHAGNIIASGGINYFPDEKYARISWDMVHPDFQGKGLGKQLVSHRMDLIRSKKYYEKVQVRTSQLAHAFYARMGFQLDFVEKDFWAAGLDLYDMSLLIK